MSDIRIAGVVKESITDGPGLRFTLFTQGCPHGCPGCHNPETHDFHAGQTVSHEAVLTEIAKNPLLAGVTFSGGDPICQAAALVPLTKAVKAMGLNIILYTGYLFEALLLMDENVKTLVSLCDYIVDGPFIEAERTLELRWRGSKNQRIIDVKNSLLSGETILAEL